MIYLHELVLQYLSLSSCTQEHRPQHVGGDINSKITQDAQVRLDEVLETHMRDYATAKSDWLKSKLFVFLFLLLVWSAGSPNMGYIFCFIHLRRKKQYACQLKNGSWNSKYCGCTTNAVADPPQLPLMQLPFFYSTLHHGTTITFTTEHQHNPYSPAKVIKMLRMDRCKTSFWKKNLGNNCLRSTWKSFQISSVSNWNKINVFAKVTMAKLLDNT